MLGQQSVGICCVEMLLSFGRGLKPEVLTVMFGRELMGNN